MAPGTPVPLVVSTMTVVETVHFLPLDVEVDVSLNEAPIDTSVGIGGTVVAGAAVTTAQDVGATVEVGAAVVVTPPAPPPSSPLPPLPVVMAAAAPLMPAWASSRVEDGTCCPARAPQSCR